MKLTFVLKLTSDYHVGAGHGHGDEVDSALLRDGDGTPSIRGSTIAGLLRDGLRDLLQVAHIPSSESDKLCGDALAQPASGYCHPDDEPCVVCRIFGSPSHPKSWIISSARLLEARAPRHQILKVKCAYSAIAHRATIDPRTRRTEHGKLFSEEEGVPLEFVFHVDADRQDAQQREDAAILMAAARMVRHLGKSRRRGRGECQLHLIDGESFATEQQLLERFEKCWLSEQTTEQPSPTSKQWTSVDRQDSAELACRILMRVNEPMIVGALRQSGNQIATSDFIPGTALLGAFAARVVRNWDLKSSKEAREEFYRIFRRGGAVFPCLYPCYVSDSLFYQTVPWPSDLLTCQLFPKYRRSKDQTPHHQATGYSTVSDTPRECPDCRDAGRSGIPLESSTGFLTVRRNPPVHLLTQTREEMHVRIDPSSKTAKHGQLYGYTSIESGQYFAGQMKFSSLADWTAFCRLLGLDEDSSEQTIELRIGRAMRRGHGHATVCLTRLDQDQIDGEFGTSLNDRVSSLAEPLRLTALTDTIIVDTWGRFNSVLDSRLLEAVLKFPPGVTVERISQYTSSRTVGSFAAHLGLPRWKDDAICAGSSVGFRVVNWQGQEDALMACLKNAEASGIGLRTQEGFGRVCFNHPVYEGCQGVSGVPQSIPDSISLDNEQLSIEFDRLQLWQWRQRLEKELSSKELQNDDWLTVAKWFQSRSSASVEKIASEFIGLRNSIAKPHALLNVDQKLEREPKSSRIADAELAKISEMLDSLIADPKRWAHLTQTAIQMLSEHVATNAKKAKNTNDA